MELELKLELELALELKSFGAGAEAGAGVDSGPLCLRSALDTVARRGVGLRTPLV